MTNADRPLDDRPARRLTRSHDCVLAGVAGGLARYFNLDPIIVRALWVVAFLFTQAAALVAYVLLRVFVPPAEPDPQLQPIASPGAAAAGEPRLRGLLLLGAALVAVGTLLLARELPMVGWFGWGWFGWHPGHLLGGPLLWPLLLLAAGLVLLTRGRDPS